MKAISNPLRFLLFLALSTTHLKAALDTLSIHPEAAVSGAIIKSDGIQYLHKGNKDINEKSLFEVGSLTKVFTALCIATYEIQHPGFLEESIAVTIPEIKNPDVSKVTVQQLATHSSGFTRLPPSFGWFHMLLNMDDPYKGYDEKKLLKDLNAVEISPKKDPYEYSNFGYGTLGLLLQRKFEKPYKDIISENIFNPLDMSQSFIQYTKHNETKVVQGYDEDGEPTSIWHHDVSAAAGAIKSSTHDMSKLIQKCLNLEDDLLSQSIKLSLKPLVKTRKNKHVGLGWHITKKKSGTIYWHNGATFGFYAFMAFSPAHQTGVVLLTNDGGVKGLEALGTQFILKEATKE